MKPILALVAFIQLGLATSFSDRNIASMEPKQAEGNTPRSSITPGDLDLPSTEATGDISLQEPRLSTRQDEAKRYVVEVTDRNNKTQIDATLKWLEGLVKDKSKMTERKFFPDDIPDDELQKLYDEGRWDDEIDNYDKLAGWKNCLLDQAGYEEVKGKTEWIAWVADFSRYVDVESRVISDDMKKPKALRARKVEWGDWDKQDAAAKDLVQASQWK
jgi:hypothetical protein